VGELPLAADLGRFCDQYLFFGLAVLLVSGAGARFGVVCAIGPPKDGASASTPCSASGGGEPPRIGFHYDKAYLLLAGLATGLVISVHSVVSFDFAVSLVPGWHMTIFPPYFVAGAIFAGFAMVVIVLTVVRKTMNLANLITDNHLDTMNKLILAMSCIMGYAYLMEGARPGTAPTRTSSTPS